MTLTGEGVHALWGQAESDYGLVSAAGATRTLFLDLYPPTVTLSALPAYTSGMSLDLEWQGGDGAGSGVVGYALEHRYGGGTWEVYASGGAGYVGTPYPLYEEGAYGFRVRAVDGVGREGVSAVQTVVADRTAPTVTLALSESSPYAHVRGDAAYYGVGDGVYTVTAVLADGTAGLGEVIFPATTGPGAAYGLDGVTATARSHAYTFTAASGFSGTVPVTATDRATNGSVRTFTVKRDATPPQVWVSAPAGIIGGAFTVT